MNDKDAFKLSLTLGMCYALVAYFRHQFNDDQRQTFASITETIERIYYPKPDLSKPTPRS